MSTESFTDLKVLRMPLTGRGKPTEAIIVGFLDRRIIDTARIEAIGMQIKSVAADDTHPKVIIDFSKVEYLSSTMLNVLVELHKSLEQRGGRLCLASIDSDLGKIFTVTKLDRLLTLCDTVDDAMKILNK